MARKPKPVDPLMELLAIAPSETLTKLIFGLAQDRPEIRRACFDFLKKHVPLNKLQKARSEEEIVMALWRELFPDLDELDSYGGGDYETQDQVANLLDDLRKKVAGKEVGEAMRRQLLDEVLPFIKSSNAGLDDELYEVAYAACHGDEDWRYLAQALEATNKDWPIDHARQIYRRLGDRQKYLELRYREMENGADFYDLATFFWNEGNRREALAVAEEGLQKGRGRMDELRKFLADRAREGGNRERYLILQFDQATDHLTLKSYKAFKKICTAEEWSVYETKLLGRLERAWDGEQIKIRMHRKEPEAAVQILLKNRYPRFAWDADEELRVARQLEPQFPEQILTYYLSGLGDLNSNAPRKEYATSAKIMFKVRHMLVDIIKDEPRWTAFAGKVKQNNLRRPAFQEEFARIVPGWGSL